MRGSGDTARADEFDNLAEVALSRQIMWEQDGEEYIDTVALGWTRRLPDPRYQFTAGWSSRRTSGGAERAQRTRASPVR